MLFALGSNSSGQLGIGHIEDVSTPTECQIPAHLNTTAPFSRIVAIAAGGNHTLVLYHDGTIFASGNNPDGRCSLNEAAIGLEKIDQLQSFVPPNGLARDKLAGNYKFCVATWEASICLTSDGHIVTCGTGNKGELGLGEGVTQAATPRVIPDFPAQGTRVEWLAASMSHAVAVLSNGDVYGWGAGRKGQLGPPAEIVWSPRKIEGIAFRARRAVCGRDFTYVVGKLDSGDHLAMGLDKWSIISNAPKTLPPWKAIGASWGSIFILLQTGEVASWGRNDHGQLRPANLPPIDQIAVGSEHVVALTSTGEVISWGWGEHGNCGLPTENGDVKDKWNVLSVPGKVYKVGAGCATTFAASLDDSQNQAIDQVSKVGFKVLKNIDSPGPAKRVFGT